MIRSKSHKARRSGLLSLPKSTTRIVVGSTEAGGGAYYHLLGLGLTLDCGANPNGGAVADLHMARLIESSTHFPIDDLLVTHFHLDHHGGLLPLLKAYTNCGMIPLPRIICTKTTWKLLRPHLVAEGFLPDGPKEHPLSVRHVVRTKNVSIAANEHSVPGSVMARVVLPNGKVLVYTGDFRSCRLPPKFLKPDLCILDCTGALKLEPTVGKEKLIRRNIMALAMETLESPSASVYVATFSTNLDRICWLEKECRKSTKRWPSLAGTSMFVNTTAYRKMPWGFRSERFVICTGVWGQPGSKLVQMSQERDRDYRLKSGDRVILAGSMPTWNKELMTEIIAMCQLLAALEVEVIVDSSLGLEYMPGLRRVEVHCSGHASFPEICEFLRQLRPKSVFATHGSADARRVVEQYCRSKGIGVVSMNHLSEITC